MMDLIKERKNMIKELNILKDNIDNTIKDIQKAETLTELITALTESKIFLNKNEN